MTLILGKNNKRQLHQASCLLIEKGLLKGGGRGRNPVDLAEKKLAFLEGWERFNYTQGKITLHYITMQRVKEVSIGKTIFFQILTSLAVGEAKSHPPPPGSTGGVCDVREYPWAGGKGPLLQDQVDVRLCRPSDGSSQSPAVAGGRDRPVDGVRGPRMAPGMTGSETQGAAGQRAGEGQVCVLSAVSVSCRRRREGDLARLLRASAEGAALPLQTSS